MSSKKDRELKKLMESRMVQVKFSEAEVLILHAYAVFTDNRKSLSKLMKKRVSPIAMKILKERKEYH